MKNMAIIMDGNSHHNEKCTCKYYDVSQFKILIKEKNHSFTLIYIVCLVILRNLKYTSFFIYNFVGNMV